MTFTAENPLPMRIPATTPPVAGDHMDVGLWPNGWRFLTEADQARFERLTTEDQAMFLRVFEGQASALADR